MQKRLLVFITAALIGYVLRQLGIPIPYMLGGIISAFSFKTFRDNSLSWPVKLRNAMLGVAGYGIGSNCTFETFVKLSQETIGIFGACLSTLFVSVLVAIYMHRHTFANLLSSIMGCMPGGMTQMTLLMEEYRDADENVVVVSQCLRLFVVEVSVPFLAINLFGGTITKAASMGLAATAVSDFMKVFHTGWLVMIPLAVAGQFIAKKIHMPTGNLLGPILLTAIFATFFGHTPPVPPPVMAFAQLNIGLYIGMMLGREKLLRTRVLIPNVLIGSVLMVATSAAVAVIISRLYHFSSITAFLAVAPGGITEMCLAGLEMNQNVAIILTYQLIRVLMLNFAVPFAIRHYFGKEATG
ncbi:MAG: AbrB family transcriptional regulator [Acidaminococcus sp.]|jgi:membrane AbrB-like protein|nr:AbrB family transcriptional regulator [Acidaminococcus sp.]MCI2114411.1 AbrB family transcriptional regulator [Acidaminococcus sp.]MCI2116200.1 AbrB family transcriptional regulator [Acidaminococcus sp.]